MNMTQFQDFRAYWIGYFDNDQEPLLIDPRSQEDGTSNWGL